MNWHELEGKIGMSNDFVFSQAVETRNSQHVARNPQLI
jgi:hypothetical protein